MLRVVADIECEVVPWTIIGVGLVASIKHIVLGYEVSRHGVQSHRQEGANDKIVERLEPPEVQNKCIECDLHNNVHNFKVRKRFGTNKQWSESIEKRL